MVRPSVFRLEIDHQLVLGRRLHRQVAGFSPLRMRSTYAAARRY